MSIGTPTQSFSGNAQPEALGRRVSDRLVCSGLPGPLFSHLTSVLTIFIEPTSASWQPLRPHSRRALPCSGNLIWVALDTFLPNGVARVAWISIKLNQNVAFFIKAINTQRVRIRIRVRQWVWVPAWVWILLWVRPRVLFSLVRQMKLASGHPHSHLNMHEEVPPRQGAYHLAKGLQPVWVQMTPSRRRATRHFTPSTNVSSYLSCGAGFFLIHTTFNENQIRFLLTLTTCIPICLGNQNKKKVCFQMVPVFHMHFNGVRFKCIK